VVESDAAARSRATGYTGLPARAMDIDGTRSGPATIPDAGRPGGTLRSSTRTVLGLTRLLFSLLTAWEVGLEPAFQIARSISNECLRKADPANTKGGRGVRV